jgi:hypothetical protein
LKTSNFLGTIPDKSDGNFLTWSSVTSSMPSPPGENISNRPESVKNESNSFSKGSGQTKNLNVDMDFTEGVKQSFSREDLILLESFKESIELLIVKVKFNFEFRVLISIRTSMRRRNS